MSIVKVAEKLDDCYDQEQPEAERHRIHEPYGNQSKDKPGDYPCEGEQTCEARVQRREIVRPIANCECYVPCGREIKDEANYERAEQYNVPTKHLLELITRRLILNHHILAYRRVGTKFKN